MRKRWADGQLETWACNAWFHTGEKRGAGLKRLQKFNPPIMNKGRGQPGGWLPFLRGQER
jgi:hypothetical protein